MILFAWLLIISPCSLRHRPMRNTSGLLPLTASSPLQRTKTNASPSSWLHPGPCETVGLFILATPVIAQTGSQVFDLLVELLSLQMSNPDTISTRPIFGPECNQQVSPAQIVRSEQTSMFARVTCYPPLGQLTCPQRIQKTLESEKDDTVGSSCQPGNRIQTSISNLSSRLDL